MSPTHVILGIITLLGVIATWVAMAESIQGLQGTYNKPAMITFIIHSFYAFMLVPGLLLHFFRPREEPLVPKELEHAGWGQKARSSLSLLGEDYPVTRKQFAWLAVALAVVTFIGAMTWYLSLPITTVPANNAIFQSMSAFVFIFSVILLGDEILVQKVVSVVVSISGMVCIALGGASTDNSDVNPETIGYFWVGIATVMYGLYEVLYKRFGEGHTPGPKALLFKTWALGKSEAAIHPQHSAEEPLLENDLGPQGAAVNAASGAASPPKPAGRQTSQSISEGLSESHRLFSGEEHPQAERRAMSDTRSMSSSTLSVDEDDEDDEDEEGETSAWVQVEMTLIQLGIVGVLTAFCLWPLLLIFHYSGIETLERPPEKILDEIILNAFLDSIFNSFLLIGCLVLSPLVMAVGSMMVVPASIVTDFLVHNTKLTTVSFLGVGLIFLGFIILKLPFKALWHAVCDREVDDDDEEDAGRHGHHHHRPGEHGHADAYAPSRVTAGQL